MAKQTFSTGQVLTAAQMTSLQQTAMGGGSPVQKTASYVLTAADAGTTIQMNSASSTTITVNTALFAAGDVVFIQNIGAGVCTITAGTATVTTAGSLALTQWEGGQLFFTSSSAAIFFDYIQAGTSIPLTTKGDLFGFDTANARIPVGANNTVLTADSAQALGVKWATPSGGWTLISTTPTTSTSAITIGSIPQTYTNLQVQIDNVNFNTTAVLRFKLYNNNNTIGSGVMAGTAFGNTSYVDPCGATSSTGGFFGSFTVTNYTSNAFGYVGGAKVSATGSVFGGADTGAGAGGFTSIVVTSVAGTATFSSGNVRLYGL